MDPYKVLGINENATDEEVKKAYRNLAKKYHPDNYANSPLSDLAQEKMKEINEAYDKIQEMRKNGAPGGDNSDFNFRRGAKSAFPQIRELINAGNFAEADVMLNNVNPADRGAEWYFLKGCVFVRRGWYYEAQKHFQTACDMDPSNEEYRMALNNLTGRARGYGQDYRNQNGVGGCSACDICTGLICADCCCEMCGGDLIRCC